MRLCPVFADPVTYGTGTQMQACMCRKRLFWCHLQVPILYPDIVEQRCICVNMAEVHSLDATLSSWDCN